MKCFASLFFVFLTSAAWGAEQSALVLEAFNELAPDQSETKLFETEIMGVQEGLASFLKRDKNGATTREVDRVKLRGYVRFFSPEPNLVACVAVRSQPGCESCKILKHFVQESLASSLKRRGFSTKSVSAGPDNKNAESLFEAYSRVAHEEGCAAVFVGGLAPDPAAPEKMQGAGFFQFKKLKTKSAFVLDFKGRSPKNEGDLLSREILAGLVVDTYAKAADLGVVKNKQKLPATGTSSIDSTRFLRVEHVQKFQDYVQFKKNLTAAVDGLKLEERFLSQGTVEFAMFSEMTTEDLLARLKRLGFEPRKETSDVEKLIITLK